jgi:hypothetical protein
MPKLSPSLASAIKRERNNPAGIIYIETGGQVAGIIIIITSVWFVAHNGWVRSGSTCVTDCDAV